MITGCEVCMVLYIYNMETQHGTKTTYLQGCRCNICCTEWRAYRKEYVKQYRHNQKNGIRPDTTYNKYNGSELEWDEVFKNKIDIQPSTNCFDWNGALRADGYGTIKVKKKCVGAHRFSYEVYSHSKIPDGLLVCHHCDNRKCINPSHLFLGTHKDNMDDMYKKGRHPNKKLLFKL